MATNSQQIKHITKEIEYFIKCVEELLVKFDARINKIELFLKEEISDIEAYDNAKSQKSDPVPLNEVIERIN